MGCLVGIVGACRARSLHVQVTYNGVLKYGGEKAFVAAL